MRCRPRNINSRTRVLTPSGELTRRFLNRLAALVGCPEQGLLVELWRNWSVVMGEEIASICLPLGHKEHRLEVGCEDSMALQELSYLRMEIMDRVNSFMEQAYFTDVKITLVLDRKALWEQGRVGQPVAPAPPPVEPACEGTYLSEMDPDSPVARAYRAFCARRG